MTHQLSVDGRTTKILIRDRLKERLQTLLRVYDRVRETDKTLYTARLYKGKRMKMQDGRTLVKGRGLVVEAGRPFVRILSGLYALKKEGFLTVREVEKIEACAFRRIVARSPFPPEAKGLRRDSRGNRALNYLIYLLYRNIKAADHMRPFHMVGDFLSEQGLIGAAACDESALYERYRGLDPEHLKRMYVRLYRPESENFPPPLPEWESLLLRP